MITLMFTIAMYTIAMCKSDYGGGGGENIPKSDYVICERPLYQNNYRSTNAPTCTIPRVALVTGSEKSPPGVA